MKGENSVFKCEATANSVTGHVCVNSNEAADEEDNEEVKS